MISALIILLIQINLNAQSSKTILDNQVNVVFGLSQLTLNGFKYLPKINQEIFAITI